MKLMFVCGSIEPGKDGVGDYTRFLSEQLINQGNNVAILALNDKYVDTVYESIVQVNNVNISVLRIPTSTALKVNHNHIKNWIDQFAPDWLSLQYVPFGYHPKGLTFGLGKFLLSVSPGRQWHIMFHELWVGMAVEESAKLKWWGRVQQFLIRSLISKLKPKVIHTQTKLYQAQLNKLGFNTIYLPLFGNIPVNKNNGTGKTALNSEISFVVFGDIHDGAPITAFAKEAAAYSRKNNIPVTLTFVGRCGSEQDRWVNAWRPEGLAANILGEQSEGYISNVLTNSTMGISATALAVIEKSGAVAAMRDHGLPVLSVAKSWQPAGVPQQPIPDGIIEYRVGNFETLMADKVIPDARPIADIALQFTHDLSSAL